MKYKGLLVILVCLIQFPLISFGQSMAALKEKATTGDAFSQRCFGSALLFGNGIRKNEKEAVVWLTRAADQGDASAQFLLGGCYSEGMGVRVDSKKGIQLYRLAAEQGHARAQAVLGICYGSGQGVSQNLVQAYAWCNVAAANGAEDAANIRSAILKGMTPEQIAEGRRLSREYADKFGKK